jgi:hypothetical protein
MNRAAKTLKVSRTLLCLLAGVLLTGPSAFADTLNLGFISFDGFIPGDLTSPGVNEFSINNLTSDPGLGGFSLPPDFPVFSFLTFQNAQLTVEESSGNELFPLGDLSPGTSISDLITASVDVLSATFSATLNQTLFSLADGSTFVADSAQIQAILSPSSGSSLAPDDFALITVTGSPAAVPEPASWCLLLFGGVPILYWRTRRKL